MTDANRPAETSPRGRLAFRVGRRLAVTAVLVAATIAGGIAFLASDIALEWVLRLAVARSDGRLAIDEPSGSLLSTVRATRIAWRGPEATLSADDVALTWSPTALFSRGIVVDRIAAQRLALALPMSDAASPLPASLALPAPVAIERVAVERLDWTVGTSKGTIAGLAFGYEGDARMHRLRNLVLATDKVTLRGEATLAAIAPYALAGSLGLEGGPTLRDAAAKATIAGTLADVVVDGSASIGEARATLHARLKPLASVVLDNFTLDAREVDLARWDETLPATRLAVQIEGGPAGTGIEGRAEAENALPGPIDARRVPVRSARARFRWSDAGLALDDLQAALAGRGSIGGRATIPFDAGAGTWSLTLADVDLSQIYAPLAATRLSGTVAASLDARRQRIDGDVADRTVAGGIGLRVAAVIADDRLDVASFRIRAGSGELAGSGRMDLGGERAFDMKATATRLDPAHFGKFPAGSLDAQITASGALRPTWRVGGDVRLAPGSKLAGAPVSGTAHALLAPRIARDVVADLKLASSSLSVRGGSGDADSRLTVTFSAPRLADLAPFMPAAFPRPIAGALAGKAELRGSYPEGGATIEATGTALEIGAAHSVAKIDARFAIEPAKTAGGPAAFAERRISVALAATDVSAPPGRFPRVRASVDGTLGQHTAMTAFAGEDLDVEARAHGGFEPKSATTGVAGARWLGTLDVLENRGAWPLRLVAPVAVELARGRAKIGAARIAVADGKVDIETLSWEAGRLSTRGAYSGVPVATVAMLAGVRLPLASTLVVGGEWSLAATPRLNGAMTLRRERGDLHLGDDSIVAPSERALGIVALDVGARFRDDVIDADAALRTDRSARIDARLSIGAVPDAPPGRISASAPLAFALAAELSTLRILQPWVGTAAVVDGAARLELAGTGTVGEPKITGTLRGAGLRIDAAEYGLHFTDGRLDATLADGMLRLDELSLTGGAGRFTASGTLADTRRARADTDRAGARIAWKAERFRVFNRPDLRLVASGAGTIAIAERRLNVAGRLRADEGHFDYSPDTRAVLGDDVVVKGWPPRQSERSRNVGGALALDLELDFGEKLTFAGEGLYTGLRGQLAVTTTADGALRGRGSITAENGSYFAFGQRLTIDRGRLIFDGPLDNPGLDIVALRKNLAVEAGVMVSGTVRVPIIKLTSNPPVPDNEKLSWLVLGRGLDRTSGSDVAALQAASAALLGRNSRPITATIAESVGIDDITFRSATAATRGTAGGAETSGQAVAFGKRLTDRLTLVYEQGLTVATNALRLEYALTRTLTLRAEAGVISGFGIYYRRTFE